MELEFCHAKDQYKSNTLQKYTFHNSDLLDKQGSGPTKDIKKGKLNFNYLLNLFMLISPIAKGSYWAD